MRAVTIEREVRELARALTSAIIQTIVETPIGELTFAGGFGEDLVVERTCRLCGCTDEYGCDGGCSWIEADLCSACVTEPAKKKRTHARTRKRRAEPMEEATPEKPRRSQKSTPKSPAIPWRKPRRPARPIPSLLAAAPFASARRSSVMKRSLKRSRKRSARPPCCLCKGRKMLELDVTDDGTATPTWCPCTHRGREIANGRPDVEVLRELAGDEHGGWCIWCAAPARAYVRDGVTIALCRACSRALSRAIREGR